MNNKTALVCGAGGFIGTHLVSRLKSEGYWVRGVDLKYPEFGVSEADDFVVGDLREPEICKQVTSLGISEIYQLAADMGGAGYLFTGENDADVMHNSVQINLNMAKEGVKIEVNKFSYASSACVYPEYNQLEPDNPNCVENSVYPAQPDSDYGWKNCSVSAYLKRFIVIMDWIPASVDFIIFRPLGNMDGW